VAPSNIAVYSTLGISIRSLAHHVTVEGGKRRLMIASLRYLDVFVKTEGAWLFSERRLYVDWIDERPLS
jgi:hypothetical protein